MLWPLPALKNCHLGLLKIAESTKCEKYIIKNTHGVKNPATDWLNQKRSRWWLRRLSQLYGNYFAIKPPAFLSRKWPASFETCRVTLVTEVWLFLIYWSGLKKPSAALEPHSIKFWTNLVLEYCDDFDIYSIGSMTTVIAAVNIDILIKSYEY